MDDIKKQDLVSVIITTYHNEKLLPRAIECLLNQTYKNIEIIVVDDNPPESESRIQTECVMKKYSQVIYLKHKANLNGATARNTGISVANGKYIAFLDNDDIYFNSHVEDCVKALQTNIDCSAVFSAVIKICDGYCWDVIPPIKKDELKTILFSERSLGTGSNLFFRADQLKKMSGFDTSFLRHQDIEFCLRFFQFNKAVAIDKVQIVKEMGGFSNTPSFSQFLSTKQHLWNTFKELLSTLDEEEEIKYYGAQYSALLYSACKSGKKEDIRWTIKKIKLYRSLSFRECMLIFLTQIHVFSVYEMIKKVIKIIFSQKIKNDMKRQLADDDMKVLENALNEGRM